MKIKVSRNSGFCFGVNRAVNAVFEVIKAGNKCCTLGPIVHNTNVVNLLKKCGNIIVDRLEEIPKDYTLVIRSHGIPSKTFENIKKLGINFIDATCPFVKKIHKIVKEYSSKGFFVLIAGDISHAEVTGIVGNCIGKSFVFKDSKELLKKLSELDNKKIQDAIVISQTTFSLNEWKSCVKIVNNIKPGFKIFNTICQTTRLRQEEAEKLSKNVDLMIVIGGKNSSNSLKLKKVCEIHCKTLFVESPRELYNYNFINCGIIGITAGASVSFEDIVEVEKVLEKKKENIGVSEGKGSGELLDDNSKSKFAESDSNIISGKSMVGTVVELLPNEVKVDIGLKSYGVVPLTELSTDLSKNASDLVHVGEKLDLVVVNINEKTGEVILSKKQADYSNGWDKVVDAFNNHTILSSCVTDVVRGGVKVVYCGIKLFIPASLSNSSKSNPIENFKGKNVEFIITELDKERKQGVASCKAAREEKKKDFDKKFWDSVKVGDILEGTVSDISSRFGVFVDLGGVEGLIHISELSWSHVESASDVVKVGQKIKVLIKDLDRQRGRISLSYKRTLGDPWETFAERYEVGQIITCKITAVKDFGAFAEIIPGVEGMIHVSQISEGRIENPRDVLTVGDEVRVKIMELDSVRRKVGLSIKNCYSIS